MNDVLPLLTLLAVLAVGLLTALALRRSGAATDDPRLLELAGRIEALGREVNALKEVSNALSGVQEKRLESLATQIQLTLDSMKKDMGERLTHMTQTAEQSAERVRNALNEQLANNP